MKKIFSIVAASVLMLGALVGCGGKVTSTTTGSTADYKTIIESVRPADTESIAIVTADTEDTMGMIDFFGVPKADMQKYAISVSLINIKAYGIAIVLPQEGKAQEVTNAMNTFVDTQKKAFENYLPDQYEIANAAQVKTMPTGEVVLVMCENASTVMADIEKQLKA